MELDDVDRQIIALLQADARETLTAIGEVVGLSVPAVADRIDRLNDSGVIRGYTTVVDERRVRAGRRYLISLECHPASNGATAEALADADAVLRVYRLSDARLVVDCFLDDDVTIDMWLATHIDPDCIRSVDISPIADEYR